ncbi:MAG TPA: DnaD domain protein [Bellilinea sp.]|nr:DnaD domain protein [Bellilinea sp.]
MARFAGFPGGKSRLTRLPAAFFTDLLPEIDHLGELKVTLYAFWFLDRLEGDLRFIRHSDFAGDAWLLEGLSSTNGETAKALAEALEQAVQRGTLLRVQPGGSALDQALYFLNTPRGKAAAAALEKGEWSPEDVPHPELVLEMERPNIYRLYEQNIGPLTPLIADALREAEAAYPMEWIKEAIRAAVEANVRRWRYVDAILRNRMERGPDGTTRSETEKDRRRYIEGEFSDFIEH